MQQDIMNVYGQELPPLFFVYQRPVNSLSAITDVHHYDISQALYELSQEYDDIICLDSMHGLPRADTIHLNGDGYRWYGEYAAYAMYQIFIRNKKRNAISPQNITAKGHKMYVEFNVECLPLVFKTEGRSTITHGIQVYELYAADIDFYETSPTGEDITSSIELKDNYVIINCSKKLESGKSYLISFGLYGRGDVIDITDSSKREGMFKFLDKNSDKVGEYYPLDNKIINFQKVIKL